MSNIYNNFFGVLISANSEKHEIQAYDRIKEMNSDENKK